jgi:tetratricopeptide (TPR) repeat protein
MPGARPSSSATVAMVLAGALLFISGTARSRADDTAADVQMADRYQQAAEKGDAAAQLHLGAIYSSGAGRPQSDREAFSWFSRAAEGGNPEAQLILSGLYAIGRGTARSNTDAYKWALVAAAGRNTAEDKNGALQLLAQLAKRMSDPEMASAKQQADAWKPNVGPVREATVRENAPPPASQNSSSSPAQLRKMTPDRVVDLYIASQKLTKSGNFAEAIKNLDEVLRVNPADPEALNNRCWARALLGDLDNALKDCDRALQLRPRYADAFDSRGLVNLKLGRSNNAVDDYDAALAMDPKRPSALYGRGIARIRKGDAEAGRNDIGAAKAVQAGIAEEFAGYGIR